MPSQYPRIYAEGELDMGTGSATLLHTDGSQGTMCLPLSPMMGCFGVAPDRGQIISSSTSAARGGNMDYYGLNMM